MVVAICPNCRCELPEVGLQCPTCGWFGVAPEELEDNNIVVGRPLGGSFVALRKIGQGGMGAVYEGKQIQFSRVVAIKILSSIHSSNEQVFARFEREAKSVARVTHPNVVQLIDSGVENGIAYIVMEYVKGTELSNIPPSDLSGQFIIHVTDQVLNALAEAHAANVIHRDLKPDNIMITSEDNDPCFVKVLDFGLATLTDRKKITVTGQALGTPWYMSPEQATASPVTPASDIYSLGCVLYELASSKPPFPGNRPYNVMMQHVNAQVPMLIPRPEIEISSELIAFILKCLQKNPADRYTSAEEALKALHQLPEWVAAGQSVATQSIKMSIMQLTEMSRMRSDVISGISAALDSNENPSVHPESPLLRSNRDISVSASHAIVDQPQPMSPLELANQPTQLLDPLPRDPRVENGLRAPVPDAEEDYSATVPYTPSYSLNDFQNSLPKDRSFIPIVVVLVIIMLGLLALIITYLAM
ncbi:MAG: serine/threonine protein kinase [Proteobacteria bacterium]|nr:serine/threonine protein kinase [Pseudomonadota bacterium]